MNYDANGRLSQISDASRTYLSGLQYQSYGGAVNSMTLGNGIQQTFGYNERMQMSQIGWAKDGNVVQRYDYAFGELDAQNNLKNNGKLRQVDSYIGGLVSSPTKQFTQKFDYDSIGRLERETETRGDNNAQAYSQKFSYDNFGNRYLRAAENPTTQNPLLPTPIEDSNIDGATNRLAANTNTLYDDGGNITTDGKYRNLKFSYDANGRMFKTSQTNDTNQNNAVYDAGGNKVATKVNDVWRFLIYDAGGKLVAEYGGTESTDQGGVKFIHQDLQGSTRCVTSQTGNVLARMDYQAFGEQLPNSIGQRTAQGYTTSDTVRQRYGLTERDEATGLDDTWFRKLDQRGGRWTSPDPYNGSMSIGNPQSFNRYSYVENQPTNFVDPSGLNMVNFVCYDLNTYWHRGEVVGVSTTTICHTFGSGGSFGNNVVGIFDIGGGGGSGPAGNSPSPKRDCNTLANIISRVVRELKKRANDLIEDYLNLPPTGKMSIEGHTNRFENAQTQLKRALNDYDTQGCGGPGPTPIIPEDAWKWATKETPEKKVSANSVATIAAGVVVGVGTAYILYRIARLLPSLAPPLWATLPANLAIP